MAFRYVVYTRRFTLVRFAQSPQGPKVMCESASQAYGKTSFLAGLKGNAEDIIEALARLLNTSDEEVLSSLLVELESLPFYEKEKLIRKLAKKAVGGR